jgi:cellulose synthase/poly-beta-1,6-N-acetylglucosamine synthase-like glycosyltransferase
MDLLSLIVALVISIPLLVVGSQCLVACLYQADDNQEISLDPSVSYRILIPAHNESAIIATTLAKIISILPDNNAKCIVLIADNCTDNTAEIAHSFNINVLERSHPTDRGKGYALAFGIEHLNKNTPPDVVVIFDADCETNRDSLSQLIDTSHILQRPAQMIYLMRPVANASIKQKIAGFAWLVKNKIRLLAMNKFNFPVLLTGTGMAFPWHVLQSVKLAHGNIVEDMQLGIDCSLIGYQPVLCPNALVYSDFPEQAVAEQSQRTRWEHGHLQTILQQVPNLILQAITKKDLGLLALALDIGVPPLALLILMTLICLILFSLYYWFTQSSIALFVLICSFIYFSLSLLSVWWRYGRQFLSAKELAGIPIYVINKLAIYVAFIFKRQKAWVRTERDV